MDDSFNYLSSPFRLRIALHRSIGGKMRGQILLRLDPLTTGKNPQELISRWLRVSEAHKCCSYVTCDWYKSRQVLIILSPSV